jgi:hypothetical protein
MISPFGLLKVEFSSLGGGVVLIQKVHCDLGCLNMGGDVHMQGAVLPGGQGTEGIFELELLTVIENSHMFLPCVHFLVSYYIFGKKGSP